MRISGEILTKCKAEYLATENVSLVEIAQRNNVNPKSLSYHARTDNWAERRRKANLTQQKRLLVEIEQNLPREIVKSIKSRMIKEAARALDMICQIRDGKSGKGAYNRFLAAKDLLDRAGFRGEDNINIKVSKIMDSIEAITSVSASPTLSTGNPESYPQLDNKVINNSHKIHYVNKNENKDNISKDNTSSTTTPSSEVIHSHKAELSTGENITQSGPIPGASEVPVAGQAVDCAPAGNAETGIGEGEGSITNIPSVTDIKKEE